MSWFNRNKEAPENGDGGGGGQEPHFLIRSTRAVLDFLWGIVRFILRILMWSLVTTTIVVTCAVLSFVFLPQIISGLDAQNPSRFDSMFGTDKTTVLRLRDPGYFAEQTEVISEKQEAIACISSPEHRVRISDPADVPPLFRNAIVASEDKDFFDHAGFDQWALLRASIQMLRGGSNSGASTIEMQIAKNLRVGTGRRSTLKEKAQDVIMALRIEREFTKEEIFLKYVNMPYFGRGQYGIEAASRAYFGKPAKELAAHQVAFIVALINKPALPDRSFANDRTAKTPEQIKSANWAEMLRGTRRVIGRMSQEGYLSDVEEARASEALDRSLRGEMLARGKGCGANSYYLEHLRILLKDNFPLNKGGLTVPIPRDDGHQEVLEKALAMTVNTYLARHQDDADNDKLRAGAIAIEFTGDVLAEVGNIDFMKIKFDVMTKGWRQPGSTFKIFTYGGLVEELTNDVLEREHPPETLDEIVAEVTKQCVVLDAAVGVSLGRGRGVKMIQNFRSNSEPLYRGNISCKLAIGESRNTAAIRAGGRAGIKNVIDFTYRLGMPKDVKHILQPYPTTAIGASEVNPLGMTSAAAFVNGGFRVVPSFYHDVCKDGKSLLYKEEEGQARSCDMKGERRSAPERIMHPAVSAVMTDILKGPLDEFVMEKNRAGKVVQHFTGTARGLRDGVIPGMDPLSSDVWKLSADERKKRMLKFPLEEAGEIAGKTGTATNADGKTSDVWLILFVPGPPDHPEKGIMLIFWMGKDSKDHPLGDRGTGTTKGFAESGGRNWTHSAATVLAFLQKERGYLKPGFKFQPMVKDEILTAFEAKKSAPKDTGTSNHDEQRIVDPSDPTTPPDLIKEMPSPEAEQQVTPAQEGEEEVEGMKD